MRYQHLGRIGLQVSRLVLGTMNFDDMTEEATSFQIMDAALDAGINVFDTADVYGGPQSPDMAKGYGLSEEIIGRWLSAGGRRDRLVLATKVYQPMDTGPNDRHLSAYHIRKACEDSLRRLRTDHIDLYQMHHVDRAAPGRPQTLRRARLQLAHTDEDRLSARVDHFSGSGHAPYRSSSQVPDWE